jgi:hypothetical protein
MRIVETKVYLFDELSDEAKEKAIEGLADINIDHEWWDCTYEDAANVGIKLTEFDIGRGNYCRGEFIDSAEDVAAEIIKGHGESCETHKTATEFLNHITEDENERAELNNEFAYSILEDYRIILQKEYEYLTSEDMIIETIKANEYEFTEDGKLKG